MKVQVSLKVTSKSATEKTLNVVISASDTVFQVKERITNANEVPFPELDLVFEGKVLEDSQNLSACGVKDGSSFDILVKASEPAFTRQLCGILGKSAISIDELGLLYVHKFGTSASQVLEALGFNGALQKFLENQKCFAIDGGFVTVKHEEIALKFSVKLQGAAPWSDHDEKGLIPTYGVAAASDETVSAVKARATSIAQVSAAFPEQQLTINGKLLDDALLISACGLEEGASIELVVQASEASLASQLASLLEAQRLLSIADLRLLYKYKYGESADQAVSSLCTGCRLHDFLKQQMHLFKVSGNSVSLACDSTTVKSPCSTTSAPMLSRHQRLLALHDRVSSREFRAKASRGLNCIVSTLLKVSSFTIHHVVTGGAVGNGTAVEGASNAEVTVFLEELSESDAVLSGILECFSKELRESKAEDMIEISVNDVSDNGLQVSCGCVPIVHLRFSMVVETHAEALNALATQNAQSRLRFPYSLAEQRVRFIKKQPEPVKVTARLLKWWCDQQQWSSAAMRPSDHLLELLAVHVTEQMPHGSAYEQDVALELARSHLFNFDTLCITWSAPYHGSHKVPAEILSQRPLMIDPCNPFINIADSTFLNPKEIMVFAQAPLLSA